MSEKTQCCKDVYLFKLIYILSIMSIRILMDQYGQYAQMILKLIWENKWQQFLLPFLLGRWRSGLGEGYRWEEGDKAGWVPRISHHLGHLEMDKGNSWIRLFGRFPLGNECVSTINKYLLNISHDSRNQGWSSGQNKIPPLENLGSIWRGRQST